MTNWLTGWISVFPQLRYPTLISASNLSHISLLVSKHNLFRFHKMQKSPSKHWLFISLRIPLATAESYRQNRPIVTNFRPGAKRSEEKSTSKTPTEIRAYRQKGQNGRILNSTQFCRQKWMNKNYLEIESASRTGIDQEDFASFERGTIFVSKRERERDESRVFVSNCVLL